MKTCNKCEFPKKFDEFYKSNKFKDGHYSICISCCREKAKKRYAANPGHFKKIQERYRLKHPESRKNTVLKTRTGITLDRYNEMFLMQNGKCAICDRRPGKRMLCVDHSHKNGKIRGLLCHQCNHAVGLFYENVVALERAVEYLNAHN